ncbi:c-type cytochrome [Pleomorphovibrio marinus]|uniref:c-type cytochrome n=1 Tax=Pleomorphovibrio marinus TaxID=2164132 RepID=UPI000E0A4146|nr:c-type cytochrome [Pleomorphovibrio marinus]
MGWKYVLISLVVFSAFACQQKETESDETATKDYIRPIPGQDEPVDPEILDKGEVLISYNACYDCHKKDGRFKGPAYRDIAKRYPRKQVYIDLLAQKIIAGGTGSWGNPIMPPHPKLTQEEAIAMASYILSLK